MSFSGYGRYAPFDRMTPDASLQAMTGRTPATAIGCAGPVRLLPINALASANLGGLSAIRKLAMPKLSPTFRQARLGAEVTVVISSRTHR
jgi:hypothetical protein